MFSFFKRKQSTGQVQDFIFTDMHSHLLPGLDDGAYDVEESVAMLKKFVEMGYKKAIMTPHIMGDAYKNTPSGIRQALDLVKSKAKELPIELEIAAEYYIDESLYQKLISGEEILSFGAKRYVLIETSYINEASFLTHVSFELQSKGFIPVLAHPERYAYLYHNFKLYEELFERGLLFQLNLNSLVGYYSPIAQKMAERLVEKKMVHFVGTDCHSVKHAEVTAKARQTKHYLKLRELPLLNNTL